MIIGIGVVWLSCGVLARRAMLRASFWKFPGIWSVRKDRGMGWFMAGAGPCGVLAVLVVDGRLFWPPIPQTAYELAERYPYDTIERWCAFHEVFDDEALLVKGPY